MIPSSFTGMGRCECTTLHRSAMSPVSRPPVPTRRISTALSCFRSGTKAGERERALSRIIRSIGIRIEQEETERTEILVCTRKDPSWNSVGKFEFI